MVTLLYSSVGMTVRQQVKAQKPELKKLNGIQPSFILSFTPVLFFPPTETRKHSLRRKSWWAAATVLGEKGKPGHEFVQLQLMLLVLSCDGVLGLLLHSLHKVLHVLEGIDLEKRQTNMNSAVWMIGSDEQLPQLGGQKYVLDTWALSWRQWLKETGV